MIIGRDAILRAIMNMIKTKSIPKVIVFSGESGTGKTLLARRLSRTANCSTENMCGKCNACKYPETQGSIIELDSALHSGVDQIKTMIETCRYKPLNSPYRFFILDEAHMLSYSAQSALLKTLEESATPSKFILLTTNPEKFIKGIQTRSIKIYLPPLPSKSISQLMKYNGIEEHIANKFEYMINGIPRNVVMLANLIRIVDKENDIYELVEGFNGMTKFEKLVCHGASKKAIDMLIERIPKRYSSNETMLAEIVRSFKP
jgi:DNA polymerase III subunit gamma/tau